ncbi:hypothetical protein ACRAWC_25405 [Leifsonia sp. L25]|uniref:hypothetical protein n=1 Tax=Leifsonia sp. L25 TaxID=3423957 RepID=UPI003D680F36
MSELGQHARLGDRVVGAPARERPHVRTDRIHPVADHQQQPVSGAPSLYRS